MERRFSIVKIIVQRAREECVHGAKRVSCGAGVGRIGLDQNRGFIATEEIARKVWRNGDDKLRVTPRECLATVRLAFQKPVEIEIGSILEGIQYRSSLRPIISHQNINGKVSRVHIDGITEKNQLKQRNAHHHGEGQSVPAHLDEFLKDNALETFQRKLRQPVHVQTLSLDFSMR
jgi:hypothetical protein